MTFELSKFQTPFWANIAPWQDSSKLIDQDSVKKKKKKKKKVGEERKEKGKN
jgi:hypothetical protein